MQDEGGQKPWQTKEMAQRGSGYCSVMDARGVNNRCGVAYLLTNLRKPYSPEPGNRRKTVGRLGPGLPKPTLMRQLPKNQLN